MNKTSFVADFSSQVNEHLFDVNALKREIEELKVYKKYFLNHYINCYSCNFEVCASVAVDTQWIYCDCSITDMRLFCSIECYDDASEHLHPGKTYPPKTLK